MKLYIAEAVLPRKYGERKARVFRAAVMADSPGVAAALFREHFPNIAGAAVVTTSNYGTSVVGLGTILVD